MPLRIKLPSHDRIIINGAVLENAGDATTLIVHNRVDILRRKEVMAEGEATTPARRIYYSLQCAYMFDEERSRYITHALEFMKQYRDAAPSSANIIAEIAEEIEEGRLYGALKATNGLIDHENERLSVAGFVPSATPAPAEVIEAPKEKKPKAEAAPKKATKKPKAAESVPTLSASVMAEAETVAPVVQVRKQRTVKVAQAASK